ncbi:hypothetical protein JG687_00017943 [Phytophthora cactorum]|uniref:Uncharacterized protein n=1 Tax=Phytophthora cactorum TaxID=29920 RepID=A0A8T1TMY9_9STRA|nr:hypothetical protein JG687_00017943 [Phytophthora cactorum]
MKPIIDLCARTKYDAADNVAQSGDNLLIMCDSKCHNNAVVPNLGTGSASSPCRIGLTCITLLDKYITIQQDPRILICWFYVCENVWDRDKRATLAPVTVGMIFLELNSLRFARDEQEF